MSVLGWISTGSFWCNERLLQARDFYSPVGASLPAAVAFAKWTAEAAIQPEMTVARGLGGLPDDGLAALEAEFIRSPARPRATWRRRAGVTGAALALLGGAGVIAAETQLSTAETQLVLSVACMLVGILVIAVAAVAGFATMHLDISHGRVGLLVGQLDEQHPWIYRTLHLICNPCAERYRQQVISERGCLRGLDYVTMREIVSANESLACTRSTRSVVEQLRQVSTIGQSRHGTVLRLSSGDDRRRRSTDTKEDKGSSPHIAAIASHRRG